jgi:hypothetical protein
VSIKSDSGHTIFAHDWEILKGERIPRWPSQIGEKRRLKITIDTWVGTMAIGAKHFYARIEEEKNMWWCEGENAWVDLSCDTESSGISMEANVMTEEEAIAMALAFIEVTKARGKNRVTWDGPGKPQWVQDEENAFYATADKKRSSKKIKGKKK